MLMKFNELCYALLVQVPAGKVTTYREIARALNIKAYRAVGRAMKVNPNAPLVPCHRVVKSDGTIGEYAFGVEKKIKLLKTEGILISNGKILDFENVLFKFK